MEGRSSFPGSEPARTPLPCGAPHLATTLGQDSMHRSERPYSFGTPKKQAISRSKSMSMRDSQPGMHLTGRCRLRLCGQACLARLATEGCGSRDRHRSVRARSATAISAGSRWSNASIVVTAVPGPSRSIARAWFGRQASGQVGIPTAGVAREPRSASSRALAASPLAARRGPRPRPDSGCPWLGGSTRR